MTDEIKKDTVDYNDPTPFDGSKLQSISDISKAIRHKMNGEDVREPIAQQGEALVKLMQETGGNQAAEVVAARGGHELLQMREDAQDNAIRTAQSTADSKFSKTDGDAYLKSITVAPETFASLAAIKAKYPSGANGLMVAADNGHKYIWANSAWTDAGVYQSVGVADSSILPSMIAPSAQRAVLYSDNIILDTVNNTLTIQGANTAVICWNDLGQAATSSYVLPKSDVVVEMPENLSAAWKLLFNTDSKSFSIQGWGYSQNSNELFVFGARITKTTYPQQYTIVGENTQIIARGANNCEWKVGQGYENLNLPSARVVATFDDKPIVSTTDQTLVFPATPTGFAAVVGNKSYDIAAANKNITVDLSAIDSSTSAWLLLLNTVDNTIFVDKYSNAQYYNNNAALLATIRYAASSTTHKYWFTANFPIIEDGLLNGVLPYTPKHLPRAIPVPGFNYPNIDTTSLTLQWRNADDTASATTGFIVDGIYYGDIIPREGLNLDLSGMTQSTLCLVLFDTVNKTIVLGYISDIAQYNDGNRYALIATIRKTNDLSKFVMSIDMPYTVDGALYGIKKIAKKSFVRLTGHRGYWPSRPENTMPSFQAAFEAGLENVETDIVWTADGVPVLLHDETINRTARNADGTEITDTLKASDLTLAQLQTYDFGIANSPVFAGTKIPTLDEFLDWCLRHGMNCFLDKPQTEAQTQKIVEMVHWHNMQDHTTYTSNNANLAVFRKYDPDCAILNNEGTASVETLQELKNMGGKVAVSMQFEKLIADPTWAQNAKTVGVELEAWALYSVTENPIEELMSMGVTGFTVNSIDLNSYMTQPIG